MHLNEAIEQRRAWKNAVNRFVKKIDPSEQVKRVFPDSIDDDLPKPDEKLHSVTLFAEDLGGSLALPHFGSRRPSADYFNL